MQELQVTILDRQGKRAAGTVRLEQWDKKLRTRRALKCLAICWLASVLSIMLPLAHFALVPGFFIGGIVGAYFLSGQASIVLGGEGVCPACGERLEIVRQSNKWPLTDLCSKCQMTVTIEK